MEKTGRFNLRPRERGGDGGASAEPSQFCIRCSKSVFLSSSGSSQLQIFKYAFPTKHGASFPEENNRSGLLEAVTRPHLLNICSVSATLHYAARKLPARLSCVYVCVETTSVLRHPSASGWRASRRAGEDAFLISTIVNGVMKRRLRLLSVCVAARRKR